MAGASVTTAGASVTVTDGSMTLALPSVTMAGASVTSAGASVTVTDGSMTMAGAYGGRRRVGWGGGCGPRHAGENGIELRLGDAGLAGIVVDAELFRGYLLGLEARLEARQPSFDRVHSCHDRIEEHLPPGRRGTVGLGADRGGAERQ